MLWLSRSNALSSPREQWATHYNSQAGAQTTPIHSSFGALQGLRQTRRRNCKQGSGLGLSCRASASVQPTKDGRQTWLCIGTCRQLSEHHTWRVEHTERTSCVYMPPPFPCSQRPHKAARERDPEVQMTSPNSYNVWTKSRRFEPDAPDAVLLMGGGGVLNDRVTGRHHAAPASQA